MEKALELAAYIPYRVEIDDRNLKIGKKIRESEKEWVPYAVLVGDNEMVGETVTVRPRLGEQFEMSIELFNQKLANETAHKPGFPSNTPLLLSKRPIFVG
jgi:threonyl-tRNA synthetase